jgi:hypothetical protein
MNPDEKQSKENNNANHHHVEVNMPGTDQLARNSNPMANENIRVRTNDPVPHQNDDSVGSEITDGEDG